MSSILDYGNNKDKCQKYTPSSLVKTMLDLADYKSNLIGKTVLENSFGTGNILKEIVTRYINSAIAEGFDNDAISAGLSQDIYGIELDTDLYKNCLKDLNEIVNSYSIPSVNWNIFNDNALTHSINICFDYVIGNPPYISYKEMDSESRISLKQEFDSCSFGKFDYCYAFIELGIKYLKKNGKLVQLIPNNIYKNVSANILRKKLEDHISVIFDYPEQKLFEKTLTSVSIFLYDKSNLSDYVFYKNVTSNEEKKLCRSAFSDKWTFTDNNESYKPTTRFGDAFHASVTIATLYNNAFIVDEECIIEEELEQNLLKKAVSPKTLRYQKDKKIIFPYKYDVNNALQRFSEEEFERMYPNIVKHLNLFKEELESRDSEKNTLWFEYGRSQALTHLNREKLLISTITTNSVEVYKIDQSTIPFSGIFITVKDENYCLDDAITILKSNKFLEYIKGIGISISGKSVRITCNDINDYRF